MFSQPIGISLMVEISHEAALEELRGDVGWEALGRSTGAKVGVRKGLGGVPGWPE